MKYSIISKYRSQLMALSMILILLFHSWDLSTKFDIINEIKELGYLGVDVFLFLSGLGISISLSKKKQSFKEYYKKRLKRILPVTYLIIIPYTIYLICTKDVPLSTLFWNATFLYYFVKPIGAFNWFASGILIFYAFAPLWHKFITKENKIFNREVKTLLGMIFFIFIVLLMLRFDYWDYYDVILRFPIFLFGMLIGQYILEDKKINNLYLIITTLLGVISMLIIPKSIFWGYYFRANFVLIFWLIPLLLILCLIFKYIPDVLNKVLDLIGKSTLEIYLLNLSLYQENEFLMKYVFPTGNLIVYYMCTIISNVLLGIVLHYGLELIAKKIKLKNRRENG